MFFKLLKLFISSRIKVISFFQISIKINFNNYKTSVNFGLFSKSKSFDDYTDDTSIISNKISSLIAYLEFLQKKFKGKIIGLNNLSYISPPSPQILSVFRSFYLTGIIAQYFR